MANNFLFSINVPFGSVRVLLPDGKIPLIDNPSRWSAPIWLETPSFVSKITVKVFFCCFVSVALHYHLEKDHVQC